MNAKTRLFAFVSFLWVSGCGTVSVQYHAPIASPTSGAGASGADSPVAAILAAAAKGNQTAVLPVSRLVIVGTSSAPAQNVAPATEGAIQGNQAPHRVHRPPRPFTRCTRGGARRPHPPSPPSLHTQPTTQAAQQAGGAQTPKTSEGTTPVPSVTTTLTSTDGTVKYAINVVQIESAIAFTVQPTNNFFSQNDFSIVRLANTRIPTTVSNTFTDETAARVKAIASVAAAIIPLAAAAAPTHGQGTTVTAPQCLNEDLVVDDDQVKPHTSWAARKTTWTGNGKCLDITLTADTLAPNLVRSRV